MAGQVSVVKIPVIRVGDTSKVSVVRVHTKDGSASSGEDYHPVSEGKDVIKEQIWKKKNKSRFERLGSRDLEPSFYTGSS